MCILTIWNERFNPARHQCRNYYCMYPYHVFMMSLLYKQFPLLIWSSLVPESLFCPARCSADEQYSANPRALNLHSVVLSSKRLISVW
jgi:hypothetical protein